MSKSTPEECLEPWKPRNSTNCSNRKIQQALRSAGAFHGSEERETLLRKNNHTFEVGVLLEQITSNAQVNLAQEVAALGYRKESVDMVSIPDGSM